MRMKILCLAVLFLLTGFVRGQEDSVLFSIDGEEVYTSEFMRVYEKNKDIVVEEEGKDFDDYFELFLDFKLKLKQAQDLKLDTLSSYLADLAKYREQLIQPYLQNPEALEELTKEAYNRSLYEVHASHILVRLAPNASPSDTIAAFEKIVQARGEIESGSDFESVAKKFSEDPSVHVNGGDLGFFTAFAMVYAFENVAYETGVDSVSQPFRTQFGYHIVKVFEVRKSPGEVEVAHIMVKKDSLYPFKSKEKIDEIYNSLTQGDDFSRIAQEHSDDLSSAKKGGKLPKFGTGRMIQPFEDISFGLAEPGDISEPFETQYGWHILKLLKKYPIGSYEDLKPGLEARVKNGSRAGYVERSLAQKVGADYDLFINMKVLRNAADIDNFSGSVDTILRVQDRYYSGDDFYLYTGGQKEKNVKQLFDNFKSYVIIDYYKDHLEETNQDFAITFKEYRDGLLLFELLQKQIWDRSETDTLALEKFFLERRDQYLWNKRADLLIGSCTQREKAEMTKRLLVSGKSASAIRDMLNEGATIHVLFSEGKLEEGSSKLPEGFEFVEGVSDIYEEGNNQFTLIRVDRIYPSTRKELNEARGEVLNDYQNYLEKKWVEDLRASYEVRINKRNVKNLKAKLEK